MCIHTFSSVPAWVPILRGVVAVLFGAVALCWPGIALPVLVALFGIAVGILVF